MSPATADIPVLGRLRAVRATEVVRAAYGVGELVAPAGLAQQALGVRRGSRERTVARLLGARHVTQAVLATLVVGPRARVVGGGVDALHALTMVGWALADRRSARQAWGEALSAVLFAGAELAVLLPPLVPVRQARLSDTAGGLATTPAGAIAISADGSEPARVGSPAPDPEQRRRERAALRQLVVAEVTERRSGRGTDELVRDLEETLAQRGLPAEPRTWLRAVASDAAVGHLYVISEEAVRDAGLEMPSGDGSAHGDSGQDGNGRDGNGRDGNGQGGPGTSPP